MAWPPNNPRIATSQVMFIGESVTALMSHPARDPCVDRTSCHRRHQPIGSADATASREDPMGPILSSRSRSRVSPGISCRLGAASIVPLPQEGQEVPVLHEPERLQGQREPDHVGRELAEALVGLPPPGLPERAEDRADVAGAADPVVAPSLPPALGAGLVPGQERPLEPLVLE